MSQSSEVMSLACEGEMAENDLSKPRSLLLDYNLTFVSKVADSVA